MPELFRMYGFLFMFFSHEHEPMHVHVIGNDGEANSDIIVKRWTELFG